MSRSLRVFEVVEEQAYEQNEDRIRVLNASLRGVSRLMSEYMWINNLHPAENEMIREELLRSLVNNHLDNLTDEQIKGYLDKIEAELESNNEDN